MIEADHLKVVHDPVREPSVERAEAAVEDLLIALGRDTSSPELQGTPARVARAMVEMLTPTEFQLTTFPNSEGYDELVIVRDISFSTLCAHHLLPFEGKAHVAYLPGDRILGLSKLARVVEMFARDLQVQERMTAQIAGWLNDNLEPKGVGVILEATHTCMTIRGVRKPGSLTVTSALHGALREDLRTRQEFLSLVGRSQA